MKSRKREPKHNVFELTPMGVMDVTNSKAAREIMDALQLYMYRAGFNAIVLNDGKLEFVKAQYVPK